MAHKIFIFNFISINFWTDFDSTKKSMQVALFFVSLHCVQVLPLLAKKTKEKGQPVVALEDPLKAETNFAFSLLRLANKTNPRNPIVLSPLSISMMLTLLLGFTKRDNVEDLKQKLSGSGNISAIALLNEFKDITKRVESNSRTLKVLNRMFVNKEARIKDVFKYIAKHNLNMEATPLDFTDEAETARTINNKVAAVTNGKIKQIISENDINRAKSLILLNAIYFNARWKRRFDVKDTIEQAFRNSNSDKTLVRFMRPAEKDGEHAADYLYYENKRLRCVALPFKDSDLTAYVILPVELFGLDKVLGKFNAATFHKIVNGLRTKKIELSIPKFSLESEFDVKNLLKKEFGRALSATYDEISDGMKIDQFKQKAALEVDEEGATAAAATTIDLSFHIGGNAIPFAADQPFLLLLADKKRVIYFEAIVRY